MPVTFRVIYRKLMKKGDAFCAGEIFVKVSFLEENGF